MRPGIVTQKDIIKQLAAEGRFTEKQLEIMYDFFVHHMAEIYEDPDVIELHLHINLGSMYLRPKVLTAVLESAKRQERPPSQYLEATSEKMKTFRSLGDYYKTLYSKTPMIRSKYLSLNKSLDEMEKEQNKIFDEKNRVD